MVETYREGHLPIPSCIRYFEDRIFVLYLIVKAMKRLYILVLLIGFALPASAQTYLAQDFGKTQAEVKQFLAAKPEVTVQSPTADLITATTEGFRIEYYFSDAALYKTLVVRYYDNAKEANTAIESFRNYYTLLQADQIELSPSKREQRFAAFYKREIHEANAFQLEKGAYQITHSKLDLDRCPGSEMKEIVENESLFAMISK